MLKVLVADDHPLMRQALRLAVDEICPYGPRRIVETACFAEVEKLGDALLEFDLVVLDLKMPGMDGFAGLIGLRRRYPTLPIVIFSATEDRHVIEEAMACGAAGYIPKTLDREAITEALAAVLRGELYAPEPPPGSLTGSRDAAAARAARLQALTRQQLKVLQLVAEGKPNKIIAFELDIAETTVKAHMTVILRKLGVHSRTQAVLAARHFFGPEAVA